MPQQMSLVRLRQKRVSFKNDAFDGIEAKLWGLPEGGKLILGTLTEHHEVLTAYAKLTLTIDSTRFSLTVPRLTKSNT